MQKGKGKLETSEADVAQPKAELVEQPPNLEVLPHQKLKTLMLSARSP
jgi:hypothetical protein